MTHEERLPSASRAARLTDPAEVLDSPQAGGAVIRGSALRLVGYAGGVGLSVVSAALMIRHLGPAGWGGYVTVSSLMTLVAGLSEFGLGNIGVREYATRPHDERIRLIKNLLGLRLALAAAGVLAALAFGVVAGYRSTLLAGIVLWGIALMITFVQQAVGVPLVTRLQLGWVTVLELFARRLRLSQSSSSSPLAQACCPSSLPPSLSAFSRSSSRSRWPGGWSRSSLRSTAVSGCASFE